MASENLNRWAKTYDLTRTSLYPLERCSAYIFQTKDVIRSGYGGNEDPHGRAPLYHVWVNDKEIYCGPNMQYAYTIYRAELTAALATSRGLPSGLWAPVTGDNGE